MDPSGLKILLKVCGVAVLYVVLAAVFLTYIAPNGVVSAVWPPSGLALAALLIGGRRYAFGVLLGAFLANGLVNHAWLLAGPIALGNTLEALLGAWLLTRTGQFDLSVRSLRDYLRMIFWAGFVACSVAAVNGSTLLLVFGFIDSPAYVQNLLHWWMGDVLGVMLVTPLILVFWRSKIVRLDAKSWFEVVALFVGVFFTGQVVFLGWFQDTLGSIAKDYWMFLLVAWVAVRLGKRATMLVLLMMAAQALIGAYRGIGYFGLDILQSGLTSYWLYVMILSIVGMALAIHISERNEAEQRAQINERKFRDIIEASPVPEALNDEHGNITFLNPAFIQTFGYTLQDIPTLADWWPWAYPDPVYRQWVIDEWRVRMEQAARAGTPFEPLEISIRCKDGKVRTVVVSAASIGAGLSSEHLVVLYDITERIAAEAQLRIAAIAFETHEAIMITDPDDRIIRVNKAFETTTGYRAEEVIGYTPHLLSSGKHDQAFYEAMWQQITSTGRWEGEIWDRRKNGEIYPKWLTITAVRDEAGEVSHYVGVSSDISQRKLAEDEIYTLAYYDPLTSLPNRRLLQDRFGQALAASQRSGSYGAVLFLDLDKFKALNDTLGHGYGDLLLVEVAQRLKECARGADTVARLGGDEFVLLIEEVSVDVEEASQKVALIAEKIRAALTLPYQLKGHEYHGSPSIGVCLYRGRAETVESLLKHADMAMYQAKDAGRNAVRFFDPVMQQAVERRVELEADLRGALQNRQLRLYYQIQVDDGHRPIGAEALIRWMHPRRGMVSPAQFIQVAEESSLILDIGQWVIETACQQIAEWARDGQMRHLQLAINVSARQFRMDDFVERLEQVIVRHGIAPERLKLELTESVVLEDVADVVRKMHALKKLGVRLSLDDFGTGYSSLAYLKQLPLDQIKIDRSFVRDITTDPNDAVMVKTIIDMARDFRLNVIAEGVETEAQLAFLRQNKCMAYQGYLFSKPVPVAQFEALARRMSG